MRLTIKHFVLPIAILALFVILPDATHAAGFELFPGERAGAADYREYIKNFYRFSIGAGILIATVLIMIGGIMWTTSAGNPGRIDKAKDYITDSIIGVVLLLGAYTILSLINPNLVNLPKVGFPKFGESGACLTTTAGKTTCAVVGQQLCVAPPESTVKFQGANTTCNDACPKTDAQGNCVAAPKSKYEAAKAQFDALERDLAQCRGRSASLPNTPTFRFNRSACEEYCAAIPFCMYKSHGDVTTDSAGSKFFPCACDTTPAANAELQRLIAAAEKAAAEDAAAKKAATSTTPSTNNLQITPGSEDTIQEKK